MLGLALSLGIGRAGVLNPRPVWLPHYGGIYAESYADFTSEGLTNRYWAEVAPRANAAAWMTALGATFIRASSATRCTAAPLWETVPSDVLRFHHDGDGVARGILLEGARTNVILQSDDFATSWTINFPAAGVAVTANAVNSPFGALTSDKLVEQTNNGQHRIFQNTTVSNGVTVALSLAMKAAGRTQSNLNQNSGAGGAVGKKYTLSGAGAVANPDADLGLGAPTSSGITKEPEGFYRCWLAHAVAATTSALTIQGSNGNNASYTGDGASGVYAAAAQAEVAAFPSSFIPTTTGSATRAADVLSRTRKSPTVISKRLSAITAPGTGSQVLWQIDDGTAANRILVWRNSSNEIHVSVVNSSSVVADLNIGNVAHNTAFKLAFRASADDFAASLNGGTVVTDTSGAMPSGMVNERWGVDSTGGFWFGTIKEDAEWPSALSDAALQSLST